MHGWEHRLPDGTRADRALPLEVVEAFSAEWERIDREGLCERVERKSASLALHWRGMPRNDAVSLKDRVGRRWQALAVTHGLELRSFDGGLELRHPGRHKGDVVRDLVASMPASAAFAYLGDDETDEDAFAALAGRGLGVRVGESERPTAAAVTIGQAEVEAFLREWLRRAEHANA